MREREVILIVVVLIAIAFNVGGLFLSVYSPETPVHQQEPFNHKGFLQKADDLAACRSELLDAHDVRVENKRVAFETAELLEECRNTLREGK